MTLVDYMITLLFAILIVAFIVMVSILIGLYLFDRFQPTHSILRNFPLLGRMRYYLENMGPELRQYFYNNDREGRPFSRDDYDHIVKSAKYQRNVIGFGSKRDFRKSGYYVRNAMFPRQMEELRMDRETQVKTKKYILRKELLFAQRDERLIDDSTQAYLLSEEDTKIVGEKTKNPWKVRSLIGMSAMSFGALGSHAITALSEGLHLAKGTWMNTGEGGLSPYHLQGGADIIMQIGPGLFGVRTPEGEFNWEELKKKSQIPQIKAFELKLAQGAKLRGGHVDAEKVTPEIAKIRLVKPYHSIDSPNRFQQFHDLPSLFAFVEQIRAVVEKPVGIKIVIGSYEEAEELAHYIKQTGQSPDFITIDGGEGGTGATYQELADAVGLPIHSALPLLDAALRAAGVRETVKIFASGKLFTPDRIAVALAMGADFVNIARGLMISVGCIQALKCHSNACPVGVATTDPNLQRALVIDEKKYRVVNYMVTLREGLFRLAAAVGIDSPTEFQRKHITYKDDKGVVYGLDEIYQAMVHPTLPESAQFHKKIRVMRREKVKS
ncbi:glutamate synthase (ferredoxin) [Seinonella peptonophila]|uniref:Glutamate synthase (Ferredoxin) n=1 Tax=Seinonella peptonophila TaxID=112248 RepID=A0A1M4TCN2_9BACL|nr:FMN-binding glutamate synthase family protein [Seinonella peptonophila]SHE42226.1 glutamate synthase (ferredoxin) [Seinonella peptonophila]